jgi:hypothetical protein
MLKKANLPEIYTGGKKVKKAKTVAKKKPASKKAKK